MGQSFALNAAKLLGEHKLVREEGSCVRNRVATSLLLFLGLVKMINAVLVFNNAGQPRLTKFYTQLVRTDAST